MILKAQGISESPGMLIKKRDAPGWFWMSVFLASVLGDSEAEQYEKSLCGSQTPHHPPQRKLYSEQSTWL